MVQPNPPLPMASAARHGLPPSVHALVDAAAEEERAAAAALGGSGAPALTPASGGGRASSTSGAGGEDEGPLANMQRLHSGSMSTLDRSDWRGGGAAAGEWPGGSELGGLAGLAGVPLGQQQQQASGGSGDGDMLMGAGQRGRRNARQQEQNKQVRGSVSGERSLTPPLRRSHRNQYRLHQNRGGSSKGSKFLLRGCAPPAPAGPAAIPRQAQGAV